MSKNLVLCCDGTNNQFDGYHTNVVRTYKVARRHPVQLTYYDPGVGTMPEPWEKTKIGKRLSMLNGLIFGDGLFDNISDAYKFLILNYEPGDKVFLFGFSRGAYTARSVAALLYSVGLLHRDTQSLLPYALNYWKSDFGPDSPGGASPHNTMMNQKIATIIVLACLLNLPYLAFCKQKEDADKKEERVEIKYLVPEANIEMVAQRLKLDSDHPSETRVICFYDTAALTLFTRTPKVILRSRYSIGTDQKTGDTTVKVRGGKLQGEGVKCEFDKVIGKDKVESCSLTDETQEVDQIQTANKGSGVKKIFNHDQEKFLKKANIDLDWKSLVPFGPVAGVRVWNVSAEGLEKVTVERWELPERDGKSKRVLFEVSTKVPVSQESELTAELSRALGITAAEDQEEETKTKIVIDHFAGNEP